MTGLVWLLLACSEPEPSPTTQWCEQQGQALGTTWSVKWQAPSCQELPIAPVLAEVDAAMSTWRDDSELSKIRTGGNHRVSVDTWQVVRAALDLAERTEGAFDPTVQPLMEVWGFHSKERTIAAPTPEALQAARAQVGWKRVKLANGSIDAGGTALDLSAIAKGHAVDRVFQAMSRRGIANLMVEVGGEVRVGGNGPRGLWALGIDAPEEGRAPGASLAAVTQFTNAGLATSGNYRNLVEIDGRKVHHTMDPRTGRPAQTDVASATVLAPTCRDADGLATAVMVLGSEKGRALIEQIPDTEAIVLVAGPDGFEQQLTSGAASLLR